ncbi:MAG: DUF438 domain-containing protein [Chloroflexi bacterium]|nr:DUF438 domain-containing protein [Chloroflexota bacterium]
MNATKTIDVKGLGHGEKEGLIFPGIESLAAGDQLRIVVEFNPIPLVYMLKAQGDFDISYEKEGPDEWILNVKRTPTEEDKKEQFRDLLKELGKDEISAESKAKARKLLESVDATTLGILEQELIREGVSHDDIRKSLCDVHLEVLRDSLVAQRIEVQAPHPVNTLMAEHVIILDALKKLSGVVERLEGKNSLEELGDDIEVLKDVSHHLVEAELHHQREEEALFPRLEKHDVVEPPSIMKMDHVEFRKRKKELYQVTHNPGDYAFDEFKSKVIDLGKYLSKELESHIFKEDNILYQIGLQVLTPEEWEEVKRECDKIGYCCFTPADQPKEGKVVDLDLRTMPPFERHERIFETWDALKSGETLRIINDHDPKPLHYQYEAEYKGQYEWEYEQSGPKDWIVKIKKV